MGEVGLSASATRFYDGGTTRWMTRDWIREAGGINVYGYVNANPINWIDPDGKNAAPAILRQSAPAIVPAAGMVGAICLDSPLACAVIAIGGVCYGGYKAINAISEILSEETEKRCEENLQRDLDTCKAMGKRDGKPSYKICEQQAMLRYSNCLSGRDGEDGINAPLPPWGTR